LTLDYWTLLFTGFSVALGLVTLFIVLRQLGLMGEQTSLMQRQLEITVKQDALMEAQLARRAELTMEVTTYRGQHTPRLHFAVRNTGSKTASDFYWHLRIPAALTAQQLEYAGEYMQTEELPVRDGMRSLRGHRDVPVYPTRAVEVGSIGLDYVLLDRPGVIRWKLIFEDGVVPPGDDFREVEL